MLTGLYAPGGSLHPPCSCSQKQSLASLALPPPLKLSTSSCSPPFLCVFLFHISIYGTPHTPCICLLQHPLLSHGLDPIGPMGESWWDTLQGLGPFLLPSSSPSSHFPKDQDRILHMPTSFPSLQDRWQTRAEAPLSSFSCPWQTSLINHSCLFALSLAAISMVSAHISRQPIAASPSWPSR